MKRTARRLLPLLGILLLIALVTRVDLDSAWLAVRRLPARALLWAGSAYLLNVALKALRWHRMARQLRIPVPLSVSLAAFLGGCFWGMVTVGRLGEFLRVEALFDREPSRWKALATCVTDRAYDVLVLGVVAIAGTILLLSPLPPAAGWAAVGVVLLGAAIALGVAARWASDEARLAPPARGDGLASRLLGALDRARPLLVASGHLLRGPRALETLALTSASWTCHFATAHLLASGLGLDVPFSAIALTTAWSALGAALPISFQGIGTRDGIFTLLLAPHGVSTTEAITLSFTLLALFYVVTLPIGALGLVWRRWQRARASPPTPVAANDA